LEYLCLKSHFSIYQQGCFTAVNKAFILAGLISGKIASWFGEITNPEGKTDL